MGNNELNTLDLMLIIWKKKKLILSISILAIIFSSVISLLMEEKFEAKAIIIPTRSVTSLDNHQFGNEDDLERALELLGSSEIMNKLNIKYDLYRHYKIDSTADFSQTTFINTFKGNVNFSPTKFNAAEISVFDTNPDTAALIANDIIIFYDELKNELIRNRAEYSLDIYNENIATIKNEIKLVEDSIMKINTSGVLSSDQIGSVFLEENKFPRDLKNPQLEMITEIKTQYARLASKINSLDQLEKNVIYEGRNINLDISHSFIVEPAYPSDKKAKPVRWIIVVISTLMTTLFSIILILVLEKIKLVKANLND